MVIALLIMALFLSGCYTIVGYPEEGMVAEERSDTRYYRYDDYDGGYSSYYYDYYDPYYNLWYPYSPYSYYYWYRHPWWYYDDYYYYNDYDDKYIPERKPDAKRRGSSDVRRAPRREGRGDILLNEMGEEEQKRDRQKSENLKQQPATRKRSASESERAPKRQEEDEEEN
jgi:hypothetical protein